MTRLSAVLIVGGRIPQVRSAMRSTRNQSLILMGVALMIIVVAVGSFFYPPKSRPTVSRERGILEESVGYVAAEEAAKVLGDKGGGVTLILPGTDEKYLRGSLGESYERGFRQRVVKYPAVRLMGHFLGQQPLAQNQYNIPRFMTLGTLQAVRQKFPDAALLVSFIGLPQFERAEAGQWQSSSPPKMIVVDNAPLMPGVLELHFSLGFVQTVLLRKPDVEIPKEKMGGTPQEIFERFFEVLTP